MRVLFLELVPNTGHKGEVKEVNDSYAINYLIPKGLAKRMTPADEKILKQSQKKEDQRRRALIEDKIDIINKLNYKEIVFEEKTQGNNKLFGAIKESDIIIRIKKDFGVDLYRKNIVMPNGHIKKTTSGEHVYIKLGNTQAKITIIVKGV